MATSPLEPMMTMWFYFGGKSALRLSGTGSERVFDFLSACLRNHVFSLSRCCLCIYWHRKWMEHTEWTPMDGLLADLGMGRCLCCIILNSRLKSQHAKVCSQYFRWFENVAKPTGERFSLSFIVLCIDTSMFGQGRPWVSIISIGYYKIRRKKN